MRSVVEAKEKGGKTEGGGQRKVNASKSEGNCTKSDKKRVSVEGGKGGFKRGGEQKTGSGGQGRTKNRTPNKQKRGFDDYIGDNKKAERGVDRKNSRRWRGTTSTGSLYVVSTT